MKNNQQGFSHVIIIFVIAAIVVTGVGFTAWRVVGQKPKNTPAKATTKTSTTDNKTATTPQTPGSTSTNSPSTPSQSKSTTPTKNTSTPPPTNASPPPNTDPSVSVVTPVPGEYVIPDDGNDGGHYIYRCEKSNPNGFDRATISITGAGGYSFQANLTDPNSCQIDVDTDSMADGTYTVIFTVYDKAGKTASASRTYNFHQYY